MTSIFQPYTLRDSRRGARKWMLSPSERSVVVISKAIKRAPTSPSSTKKKPKCEKSMTVLRSSTSDLSPRSSNTDEPTLNKSRSAGSTGASASRSVLVVDRRVQVLVINDDIRDQSAFWCRGESLRECIPACICPRRPCVSRLRSCQVLLFFTHVTNRQPPNT